MKAENRKSEKEKDKIRKRKRHTNQYSRETKYILLLNIRSIILRNRVTWFIND